MSADGIAKTYLVASDTVEQAAVKASFNCGGTADGGGQLSEDTIIVDFTEPSPRPRLSLTTDTEFVLANGTDKATLTAKLTTATGAPPAPTLVTFSTTLGELAGGGESGKQELVVQSDASGIATVEFTAGLDTGTVTVEAEAEVEAKQVHDDVQIKAIQSGTVTCSSVSASTIGLKGSGHQDNSTVIFKVQDNEQNPIPKLPIEFSISNAPGGVNITPTSGRTDNSGLAQTLLYAGTVPTTVTVTAKTRIGEASCPPIVITTGIPNARYLNFSCQETMINVGGMGMDLIEQPCTVALADRFSNKIPFATKVFFRTEAGAITPSAETAEKDEGIGTATVTIRTQDPRPKDVEPLADEPRTGTGPLFNNPRDGLVTVIVATTGEEEFNDENGNGEYDDGESFVDVGEPFVDMDDNNQWDADEPFIDWNQDGQYNGPNGVWDGNAVIWKPTWVVWTGGVATVGSCSDVSNTYSVLCPESFDIGNGGSMDFNFYVKDYNLLPINSSGAISVKVADGPAKIIGTTDFLIAPSRGIGITSVRTQDTLNPKVIHETYSFGPYSSGFHGGFILADDSSETFKTAPAYITATTEYLYDPSNSAGAKYKATLTSTGTMDSSAP
jgi:hypothetical protein